MKKIILFGFVLILLSSFICASDLALQIIYNSELRGIDSQKYIGDIEGRGTGTYFQDNDYLIGYNDNTNNVKSFSFDFKQITNITGGGKLQQVISNSSISFYNSIYFHGDGFIHVAYNSTDQCLGIYNPDLQTHRYVINVNGNICTIYEDGVNITTDSSLNNNIYFDRIGGQFATNFTLGNFVTYNETLSLSEVLSLNLTFEINYNNILKTDLSSLTDKSSNGNHAKEFGNITYTNDTPIDKNWVKGSFSFDGINDYIELDRMNLANGFTTSSYSKLSNYNPANGLIGSDDGINRDFNSQIFTDQRYYCRIWTNTGNYQVGTTNGLDMNWTFLNCRYNLTHLSVYVDGVFNNTIATSGTLLNTNSKIRIGRIFSSGNFFNGSISNVQIFNTSLSDTQISSLYQTGSINAIILDFFNQLPQNGTTINQSILMNYSLVTQSNNTYCNVSVEGITVLNLSNQTTGINSFLLNDTWLSEDINLITMNCTDPNFGLSVSDSKYIIYDIVFPTFTINPTSTFKSNNASNGNQYTLENFFVNITYSDNINLFATSFNLSKDGVTIQNYTFTNINNLTFLLEKNFSISSYPSGVYDITIKASDGHTKNKINPYEVKSFLGELEFKTEENNNIKIKSDGSYYSKATKHKDKYSYEFNYLTISDNKKFTIESDNKIFYIEKSDYNAHFVVWNEKTLEGNWIDFEGLSSDYTINKISDYKFEIYFKEKEKSKIAKIDSLGGLNTISKNFTWYKGAVDSFLYNNIAVGGSLQNYSLFLQRNSNYIQNIDLQFLYNNDTKTTSKFLNSTTALFYTAFNVALESAINNISLNINITQSDSSYYNFTLNYTQSVNFSSIVINFTDEKTLLPIYENISVEVETSSGTNLYKTNQSFISIGLLGSGEVKISASSENYPKSSIYVSINNVTEFINFFMLKDAVTTSNIVFFIQDRGLNPVPEARMTFLKRFNTSSFIVSQDTTDSLGLAQFYLDTESEYSLIIQAEDFPISNLTIKPIYTEKVITLDKDQPNAYFNSIEGFVYSISPKDLQINFSNDVKNIEFTLLDSDVSLEYFGIFLTDNSLPCIPESCQVNLTNTPGGGTVTLGIIPNQTGTFQAHFFYKKIGEQQNYINGRWFNVFVDSLAEYLKNNSITKGFLLLKESFAGKALLAVFSAILSCIVVIIGAQLGIVGMGLVLLLGLFNIFLMITGYVNVVVGLLMIISSIGLYVFMENDF